MKKSIMRVVGLDYFFSRRATPFAVCLLYLMVSFFTTAIIVLFGILGDANSLQAYTLVDRLLLSEYVDSLPVLIKLSNQWGFGGYYQLARDVYIVNFLLLFFGMIYNSRQSVYWQVRMASDIDSEPLDDQDIRLDGIDRFRKIVFFCTVALVFFLLFDDVADGKQDYFGNRMIWDPWNAMRVPLMASLLYSCVTYLMITNHIFLFFEEDDTEDYQEGSSYLKQPVRYDYTDAGEEEAIFTELRSKEHTT